MAIIDCVSEGVIKWIIGTLSGLARGAHTKTVAGIAKLNLLQN